MNAKQKAQMIAHFSNYLPAELEKEKQKATALIANPGDAKQEDIQSANDFIEVVEEIQTAPAPSAASANSQLAQRDADEKEIKKMVAGGLERNQAEAALRHKKEFTIRHAEVKAAAAKK